VRAAGDELDLGLKRAIEVCHDAQLDQRSPDRKLSGIVTVSSSVDRSPEAPDGPGYAYIDGRLCPIIEAKVPLMDWGLLRSDATYDVIKVTEQRFFRIADHIARLKRSTGMLGLQIAESFDEVARILAECVARSELETCVAYAIVTRGVPPLGMSRDPRQARNRLYAMALPIPWLIDPADRERALRAVTGAKRRIDPASVDPTVKNFHWLDLVQSVRGAHDEDADTAILLDLDGNVTEGPGFNVFLVSGQRLITPDRGVLLGITRKSVLEIGSELGLTPEVRTVSYDELCSADEAFGTSSAGGVVPLGSIDGRTIGEGRPGPVTNRIRDRLAQWQISLEHSTHVSELRRPATADV
jgi:branched-chain amino acid aminotransferase